MSFNRVAAKPMVTFYKHISLQISTCIFVVAVQVTAFSTGPTVFTECLDIVVF